MRRQQLDALSARIISENACPELAAQATQLVMGDGDVNAQIVLIGEAPGRNEDEQGKPFVGAAGKVLNELLAHAGLAREQVYITNIVKYRPPNNRDPLPAEKAAFLPYLLEELAIIQPRLVITLGRHSMEYFLPDAKISDVHGTIITYEHNGHQWCIAPLYHPAAAIYNRTLRQTMLDDMATVVELVK